ncbi:hypothetical protein Kisp01_02570 [Kineosporia sp. NBRC 101677]|nr:hypothetical protein Kisp01_02570 [Kineosporia sp. NBRC 101677]
MAWRAWFADLSGTGVRRTAVASRNSNAAEEMGPLSADRWQSRECPVIAVNPLRIAVITHRRTLSPGTRFHPSGSPRIE